MHHGKQSEKIASTKTTNIAADKMAPTIVSFMKNEKATAPVLSASAKINKKEEKVTHKQSYRAELNKHVALQNNKINPSVITTAKAVAFKKENASQQQKRSGGDTNIILLVILSLFPFICLIAMYLHDGKSVTLNFWICLLLHLTIVLWFIFALLVDFDVINLAW